MPPLIRKVCGLRQKNNVADLQQLPIDWMGFIFYAPSPRAVSQGDTAWIALLSGQKKVGVFVNEDMDIVQSIVDEAQLDMVQLHGDESPQYCSALQQKIPVIKAFSIGAGFDFDQLREYEAHVDYFLFDTKHKNVRGGSGHQFDWTLLDQYRLNTPFFISGGIGPNDADSLNDFSHPLLVGVDINSKFEESPGLKRVADVQSFIKQLK